MKRELLYRFFCGKASVEEVKRIKVWSSASKENYNLLLKERQLFDAMQLIAVGKNKFETNVSNKNFLLWYKYKGIVNEIVKIAAIVLLTIGITIPLVENTGREEIAMHTVTVPLGQRVNLTLPDGTDVWLNAGTKMSYPLSFLTEKREVNLDGEAYFDVAHNEQCPFIVHTYAKEIEVLGTQFDVEAYKEKNIFQTSLIQGKVKISSQEGDDSVILSPGHKASIEQGELKVEKIGSYDIYRWREGLYTFRNKEFAEIVKDLEKYYDISFDIQNDKIGSIILSGKFRISEGLDYLLRVLQSDVGFSYYRNLEENIIYIW